MRKGLRKTKLDGWKTRITTETFPTRYSDLFAPPASWVALSPLVSLCPLAASTSTIRSLVCLAGFSLCVSYELFFLFWPPMLGMHYIPISILSFPSSHSCSLKRLHSYFFLSCCLYRRIPKSELWPNPHFHLSPPPTFLGPTGCPT